MYIDPVTNQIVYGSPAKGNALDPNSISAFLTNSSGTNVGNQAAQIYQSPTDLYNTDMKKAVWGIANDNNLNLGDWSSLTDDQKAMFNPEQQNFIQNNMQDTPWYQNYGMISSFADAGSSLAQLASLPMQYKLAKGRLAEQEHNLATAKKEQARRDSNIAGFNRPRGTTSAMV